MSTGLYAAKINTEANAQPFVGLETTNWVITLATIKGKEFVCLDGRKKRGEIIALKVIKKIG